MGGKAGPHRGRLTLLRVRGKALERHDQLSILATEALESMVPVELCRGLILGIDDQGKYGHLRARRSDCRVGKQRATEPLTVKGSVNRKAAHTCNGHRRVARQSLGQSSRQFGKQDAACGQRVVAGDLCTADVNGDVAGADPAPHVLTNLASQVVVKRLNTARERGSIMSRAEYLDAKGCGHYAPAMRRLRALSARFMAGASGGGFSRSSTKRF